MKAIQQPIHPRVNTTYELFIGALSVLGIFNILLVAVAQNPVVDEVLFVIDIILSVIFFFDFAARLLVAPSRTEYFFREFGWADLLSAGPVPLLKLARIPRILRVGHIVAQSGSRRLVHNLIARRAESTLLIVTTFLLLIAEFGGIAVAYTESPFPGANIRSGADAVWYVFVTITTVGYGDRYPVTQLGRLMGIFIMLAGVGIFAVFTGYVANLFFRAPLRKLDRTNESHDPREQLANAQAELLEYERALAELRKKLNDIERGL